MLLSRRCRLPAVVVVVATPFLVAAIVLATSRWVPVLDLAMTELRVRDVGTGRTTLIGLPGRIGKFPDQGSHPGPLSFYLLTPVYRLLGSQGWGLLVATCLLGAALCGWALWIAYRLWSWSGVAAVTAGLVFLMRGFGMEVLSQPWNPYLPLLPFVVCILSVRAVMEGHHRHLVGVIATASLCAQTHISYLPFAAALVALALLAVALDPVSGRSDRVRSLTWSSGLGVLLSIPLLVDQLIRNPGNLRMLARHFLNPSEAVLGFADGATLIVRHLDVIAFASSLQSGDITVAASTPRGSLAVGGAVLVSWIASAAWSWRARHRGLFFAHGLVATLLAVGAFSAARVFGKVWFYLTLWAFVIGVVVLLTVVETVARLWAPPPGWRRAKTPAAAVGAAMVCALWGTVVVDAATLAPPEKRLSTSLRAVLGATESALEGGVGGATGREGTYLVAWNDAYFFGSQGYGLVNELERRGFRAGAESTWRVPLTEYRVVEPDDATAVVMLATGAFIEAWSDVGDATEVALVDQRNDSERAAFDRFRRELIAGLSERGLINLIPMVTSNLFGVLLDPRLPLELQRVVNEMLVLGQPTAIFVMPVEVWRGSQGSVIDAVQVASEAGQQ